MVLTASVAACVGAGDAAPSTSAWCSRSAQILSKAATSTQIPAQRSHSRNAVSTSVIAFISSLQRGQLRAGRSAAATCPTAVPQRGQCLLPRNMTAKHAGQATVANCELQYWHCGASDAIAAPQFGQLSVSGCIARILAATYLLDYRVSAVPC